MVNNIPLSVFKNKICTFVQAVCHSVNQAYLFLNDNNWYSVPIVIYSMFGTLKVWDLETLPSLLLFMLLYNICHSYLNNGKTLPFWILNSIGIIFLIGIPPILKGSSSIIPTTILVCALRISRSIFVSLILILFVAFLHFVISEWIKLLSLPDGNITSWLQIIVFVNVGVVLFLGYLEDDLLIDNLFILIKGIRMGGWQMPIIVKTTFYVIGLLMVLLSLICLLSTFFRILIQQSSLSIKKSCYFVFGSFALLICVLTVFTEISILLGHNFGIELFRDGNCSTFYCSNVLMGLFQAFYLVLMTLSTTGFGDITPVNQWGQLAVIVMILSGMFYLLIFVAAFMSSASNNITTSP